MKDRPIMCVTEILDDDTGIWASNICDTSTNVKVLERILKDYGKEGYKEILGCLNILRRDLETAWETIREGSKLGSL